MNIHSCTLYNSYFLLQIDNVCTELNATYTFSFAVVDLTVLSLQLLNSCLITGTNGFLEPAMLYTSGGKFLPERQTTAGTAKCCCRELIYQSITSLTPPPPPPGHKKVRNPDPWGRKIVLNRPSRSNYL